ncbi:MAG: hypothetical protein IJQ88_05255 [Clostridia bacterium]|nr:hypothetical protein [Clostridia bacterium]
MSETIITATRATTAPQYEKTAAGLLEACRTFYRNPENEKAFQEWKEEKRNVAVDRDRVRCG